MSTSKLQRYVSQQLSIYFGQYTIRENSYPTWLTASEGERLELDFLIEELGIAIEVQGKQHYTYIPHFHGDYDGFLKRLEWDEVKRRKCEAEGVRLIEIASEDDFRFVLALIPPKTEEEELQIWLTKKHNYIERKARKNIRWIQRATSKHRQGNQIRDFLLKSERLAREFEERCPRPN